jgi:hypothetical protein
MIHKKGGDVIFLQDYENSWFHFGIKGLGNSISELGASIARDYAKSYEHTVTIGNSMGGYAAIAISPIIDASLCLAISPQTFIDEENRKKYDDIKNRVDKSKVCRETKNPELLDLKSYFEKNTPSGKTKYILFYGENRELDVIHSKRMEGVGSFHLFKVKGAAHNTMEIMRQAKVFGRLVGKILHANGLSRTVPILKKEPALEYDSLTADQLE